MTNIKKTVTAWVRNVKSYSAAKKREALLNPNKNSRVKVEEYELPLSQALVIGHREFFFPELCSTPQVEFRPYKMTCNMNQPGIIFIVDIKVANISASVTNYVVDAYSYNPQSNHRMHLPTLKPQTMISVQGFYPGLVPNGMREDTEFFFCCTFHGYAEMVGNV
jgi:hypothetical protein